MDITSLYRSVSQKIDHKSTECAAFFDLYYFVEIINVIFIVSFLYGTYIAAAAGLMLSALLTFHIIRLYFDKPYTRIIQLFVMDIHAAYALVFAATFLATQDRQSTQNLVVPLIRTAAALCELILIIKFTPVTEKYKSGIIR